MSHDRRSNYFENALDADIRSLLIATGMVLIPNLKTSGGVMKARFTIFSVVVVLVFALGTITVAQEKPYTLGSVWSLTFVKTVGIGGPEYVKNLAANWKKVQDEAINQGLVLSYKVLWGEAANEDDWDMLLMVEYKNYAAFDTPEETWDNIVKQVIGENRSRRKAPACVKNCGKYSEAGICARLY